MGIVAFLALVSGSGLFLVGLVEMAFTLLMRLPQRLEAERESEGGAIDAYLDDPLTFFIPARVLRGTLLILATIFTAQLVDPGWVGGVTLFATMFFLAFGLGQFVPAIIVRLGSPERTLNLLLPVFTIAANAISPLTALVTGQLSAIQRPEPSGGTNRNETTATGSAATGEASESDQAEESKLLRSVVEFGDTLVREVMTPRPDIVAIRSDATIDDLRRLIQEQEYSRLPVYAENLDNIVGLVVVKDLIQVAEPLAGTQNISAIMRPAAFVPETKQVMDVLREFQQKRLQLAIVVDEYGGTAGLVTVEDVVEELVGEIRDEYDSEADPIVRETDDTYVFSAKVSIEEMIERLGVTIEDDGFETVGGYVLARVGRVPAVGEHFESDGLEVEVLEAERRRVHKVRVRRQLATVETE
jgi:CBS domain containing-hemolysin-like protein